jgi:hypothetical protein
MAVDDPGENIREIAERIDVVEFAGLCRPPNYAESGPVWRVVVPLVSSIACAAA